MNRFIRIMRVALVVYAILMTMVGSLLGGVVLGDYVLTRHVVKIPTVEVLP